MKLADLDLNLLVLFDALMSERSVSRAAARVGVGQPAASAALGRLRQLFHDELFVRADGEMRPTPKALSMAGPVTAALAMLRQTMDDAIPFDPAQARRTFTVASTDYTSLVLLPPVVAAVGEQSPSIDLRVVGYDKDLVAEQLQRDEIDLALGVFADPPPDTVRTALYKDRFVGLARRTHPALGVDGNVTLERFVEASHALVSVRRDAHGAVDDALLRLGFARRVALTVPHMMALPEILRRSDLLVTLPVRAAERLANDTLVTFDLPLSLDPWQVSMLWSPRTRADKPTRWLRGLVTQAARNIPLDR